MPLKGSQVRHKYSITNCTLSLTLGTLFNNCMTFKNVVDLDEFAKTGLFKMNAPVIRLATSWNVSHLQ